MKLKTLLGVVPDAHPIHLYVDGNDDFEIHAARLDSVPEKFLVTMWGSDVACIFADDAGTLIVGLKGDDDDDEGVKS